MNLVLSGPIDDSLRNLVVALSTPRRVVRLHARADRLEGATDDASTRQRVATLCDAARVDHAYIEEGVRFADFKLLAMDMDSTLITIECIDEIADYAGKKAEVAAITEAAMRGEMDFADSLRRRVALLAGLTEDALQSVWEDRTMLSPGAATLVRHAKEHRAYTVVLSGGFTYFTSRVAMLLSLDADYANVLQFEDGVLTGSLQEPIFDAQSKARKLVSLMEVLGCDAKQTLVIGDGANDVPMMKKATFSVAYKAKWVTKAQARLCVQHGSLNTITDYFE